VYPVADDVYDHTELKQERPIWIEETEDNKQAHSGAAVGQHVQQSTESRRCQKQTNQDFLFRSILLAKLFLGSPENTDTQTVIEGRIGRVDSLALSIYQLIPCLNVISSVTG